MISADTFIEVARAVGESNRLRMLCLCRTRRVAVSEFAAVLGISEPSVSRHIKLLEEAGLVSRLRQGQRIYFAALTSGDAAVAAGAMLDQLDPSQQPLLADRERLAVLRGDAAGEATGDAARAAAGKPGAAAANVASANAAGTVDSRLERALAACVTAELRAGAAPSHVSVSRCDHLALLQPLLAGLAPLQVVVDDSAQRQALERGLLARQGGTASLRIVERRALRTAAHSDVVLLDCSGDTSAPPAGELLRRAATELAPSGRLWLFVAYDALDGGAGGEHPLLRLRRLLAEAGLHGERLQPVEAGAAHILFSVASLSAQSLRAAG